MIHLAGIALLLAIGPEPWVVKESVAEIELSHVYADDGRHVLTQLIFRDWHHTGEYRIIDWRLVNKANMLPRDNRVTWWDGDVLRQIRATSVIETWRQHDREAEDRAILPLEHRRELRKPGRGKLKE